MKWCCQGDSAFDVIHFHSPNVQNISAGTVVLIKVKLIFCTFFYCIFLYIDTFFGALQCHNGFCKQNKGLFVWNRHKNVWKKGKVSFRCIMW